MLNENLSKSVLIVGTDFNGKGGIATVIKSQSNIMSPFNYLCSHRFDTRVNQLLLTVKSFVEIFFKLVGNRNIKIVHIHTASYRSFYISSFYVLISKLFGRKVILHLHGGEFFQFFSKNPHYVKYILSKSDFILCVSKFFLNNFKDEEIKKRVHVLYNPVECPMKVRRKSIFEKNEKRKVNVTFMGTIDDNKGIFKLLELLSENKEYYQNRCIFNIAGIGEVRRLKELLTMNSLNSFVKYLGWIEKEEKEKVLLSTDIYIQPSQFESLGIAIIEAMSYGIPVVASKVGGIPEVVDHGLNGLLFDYYDFDQFDKYLRDLIETPSLRKALGEKAIIKSSMFTYLAFEKNLCRIYKSLL